MKNVIVGMFKLPGISFDKREVNEDITNEMESWSDEVNCGMKVGDRLWSFTDESQRDFFILRWSDSLLELDEEAPIQGAAWQGYLNKVSQHVTDKAYSAYDEESGDEESGDEESDDNGGV